MGLTKQYLRFTPEGIFGAVASKICNASFIEKRPYRFVVSGGSDIINVWDIRFQRRVRTLTCPSPAVVVEPSLSGEKLAVGHFNGAVSIYDLSDLSEDASPDPDVTFEGHTSEITTLAWDDSEGLLASGSKDTKVIVWDIVSETGLHKFTGHKGVITRLRFWEGSDGDEYLVTSSFDTTVRIWNLATKLNVHTIPCTIQVKDFEIHNDIFIIAEANLKLFKVTPSSDSVEIWDVDELGTLLRQAHDRPSRLQIVDETGVLMVLGDKSPVIETFRFYSEQESKKKKAKRLRKNPADPQNYILKDLVRRGEMLKASENKIKSIAGVCEKGTIKVMCCLHSNQLEILSFPQVPDPQAGTEPQFQSSLMPFDGHRKFVRAIAFSSDNTAILTASWDSFKVWNRNSLSCILTIPHEFQVVCCMFCPGDRHFVAGSMEGQVILGDISTGSIIQVESNGNDNVWGIDIFPNEKGFAASNGDLVQLYDFAMRDGKLQFDVIRQLDVKDSVICLKISKNMKFLAVGVLDSTVKIFYLDTLKFHLSMYGHSLPVVSLDISDDSTLLVTCSKDKTVKVWGLDFGDCHCSLINKDTLVGCAFLHKTHLVTSVAQDSVNIYDADSHIRVQTIKTHVGGGATCMGSRGFFIASAGRDQTIRLFKRSDEILVLDDEREQEREEELEKDAKTEDAELVTLASVEGEKWADKVIEAIDVFKDPNSAGHALLTAFNAKDGQDFLYKSLSQIKASELQQSLMMLPMGYVRDLIPALQKILENYPLSVELVVRCLASLMKFHLVTVRAVDSTVLKSISEAVNSRLNDLEKMILMNKTALEFLYDAECEKEQEQLFRELAGERKRKRKKRESALKRAILTL